MTPRQLDFAIQRLLDGSLPPDEFGELKQALASDPAALETYLECVDLHTLLRAHASSRLEHNPFPNLVQATIRRQQRRALRISMLAAAAVVLLAAVALRLILTPEMPPALTIRTSPDTLLVADHAATGKNAPEPGTLAVGSRLTIQQGVVELNFSSGVRLIVQSPADLTLREKDKLYLATGKIWCHVPPQAAGFQVETRELLVTDLGTEFAVHSTEKAGDEVHVFDGRVRVNNRNGLRHQATLDGGQARLAGPAGRLREIPLYREGFLDQLPTSLPHFHWSFDGGDPLRVAGTLPNATEIETRYGDGTRDLPRNHLVPGVHGTALRIGHDSEPLVTNWSGFLGLTARSFACWIKLHPDDPEGWGVIADWGDVRTHHDGPIWRVRVVPENARSSERAVLRVSYSRNWIDGSTNLADGRWHHIAVVQGSDLAPSGLPQVRLFVDGAEEALTYRPETAARGEVETRPGQPLIIGRPRRPMEDSRFRGDLDELFLFEGTLGKDSIQRLMTTHQP